MTTATPRKDGLRARLLRHFKASPHDDLTCDQVVERFGVSWVDAFNTRKYMQRLGELARGTTLRLPKRGRQ